MCGGDGWGAQGIGGARTVMASEKRPRLAGEKYTFRVALPPGLAQARAGEQRDGLRRSAQAERSGGALRRSAQAERSVRARS